MVERDWSSDCAPDLAVYAFLYTEAYWGRWRGRSEVDRQLDTAWRVVGAYEKATGALVGFARAVSDGVSLAYLADVFVDRAHRGRGLGKALVAEMIEASPGADFRWMLHTLDAHDLYREFGFAEPTATYMERPASPEMRVIT
jgi:GNAT superfamily N-acetyltransferase